MLLFIANNIDFTENLLLEINNFGDKTPGLIKGRVSSFMADL